MSHSYRPLGSSNPLITVVTASYNYDQFIRQTIDSVLDQDYPNLEYIVLDDGSTDGSRTIIEEYSDRLVFGSHANIGEAGTINEAFAMARGEIIGVVNSDDFLLPEALSLVAEEFVRRTDVVGVYGSWQMVDEAGTLLRVVTPRDHDLRRMYEDLDCFPAVGTFFRREVLDHISGRDPAVPYLGDLDFWLRAVLIGPFSRMPHTLGAFRVHPDSVTENRRGRSASEQCLALFRKVSRLSALPIELRSRRTRRRMKSSAFRLAGRAVGSSARFAQVRFLLRALLLDPGGFLIRDRNRLITLAAAFLGPAYPPLRRVIRRLLGRASDGGGSH